MATAAHTLVIRTITIDGELVAEDTDFAEDARFEWFNEIVRQADDTDVVQLIDSADDSVLLEHIVQD